MRKNFSKKTVLLPLPVYIIGTYDDLLEKLKMKKNFCYI